jgi:voltage-gated potassium channel
MVSEPERAAVGIATSAVKSAPGSMRSRVKALYEGRSERAIQFRYGLLVFDIVTVLFLVVSSFIDWSGIEFADAVIGVIILADVLARLWISDNRLRTLLHPLGIVDLIVVFSLLAPMVGEGFAFLRVLRMLRLLRSYELLARLRLDFPWFRRNEQTALSALNLAIFMFIMTAIVYETQHASNPKIANYLDALYFTVTALTTTGFGDIVLEGLWGRLISVVIMIFGVSLFLRLVQVMLRPIKVIHKCPQCGLKRHEYDAVHCKACGHILNIEDEGAI